MPIRNCNNNNDGEKFRSGRFRPKTRLDDEPELISLQTEKAARLCSVFGRKKKSVTPEAELVTE